jgi:hypothetical protein
LTSGWVIGLTGLPSISSSKCRCGAVERPVLPTKPISSPRDTLAPGAMPGAKAERWPYTVASLPGWSMRIQLP